MDHYWDITGTRRDTDDAARRAILSAMGFDVSGDTAVSESLAAEHARRAARRLPEYIVTDPAWDYYIRHLDAPEDWYVELEGGGLVEGRADTALHLPPLPLGRHRLVLGGETCWILAAPPSLPLPERAWGVTAPLYGLRTPEEGGLGDFGDLAIAAESVARHGAAFLGINPIHAGFPSDPTIRSPYMPSHRRRLNIQHIPLEGLAGAGTGELIDYEAEVPARLAALKALWAQEGETPAFRKWRLKEGGSLEDFATHQALSEEFGPLWTDWPEACRDPRSPEVERFRHEKRDRVAFHAWLQFIAERHLAKTANRAIGAGLRFGLYLDLAVGTHPHGAETWAEPDVFAPGVSLGAPPDPFAEQGQTWMLAPFNPRALIQTGFEALAATLRKQFQFARLLRIDHILGFERAFWVPVEAGCPGTYVRMPKDAMLAVVRIEAARAGATVIGEDLGNIPEGLQADLAASGILGCRLALFDSARENLREAADYAEQALASWGSHDGPAWAGWRAGRDIELREELGFLTPDEATAVREERARVRAALEARVGKKPGPDGIHRFVGKTPSRLVALQIEDILGLTEQPNLPGTVDEYPNWKRRLPVSAAALGDRPELARAGEIMRETGRG